MTDRTRGFVVTLDERYRIDDAEPILEAIAMIKGVASIHMTIDDPGLFMAQQQTKHRVREKLMELIQEELI